MSRDAYVKDGRSLQEVRKLVTVHPSTRDIARVLSAEWGVSLAEAIDMAVTKCYEQKFGRSFRAKDGEL
jgi:hypothetical protein